MELGVRDIDFVCEFEGVMVSDGATVKLLEHVVVVDFFRIYFMVFEAVFCI